MARSPVTDLLEQFKTLNEVERKVFLDLVSPEPEPVEAPKQTRKKRGANKPRIAGLPKPGSEAPKVEASTEEEGPMCNICHHNADYQDHFAPSPNYHPFEPPVAAAAKRSRQKKEGTSSTVSSEGDMANVMSASSGGD